MRYSLTSHLLPLTSKKPLTSPKSACVNKFLQPSPLPQNAPPSPYGQRHFFLWPTRFFSLAYQQILLRDSTRAGLEEATESPNISASFFAIRHSFRGGRTPHKFFTFSLFHLWQEGISFLQEYNLLLYILYIIYIIIYNILLHIYSLSLFIPTRSHPLPKNPLRIILKTFLS